MLRWPAAIKDRDKRYCCISSSNNCRRTGTWSWRFCDSDAADKAPGLLTYLLTSASTNNTGFRPSLKPKFSVTLLHDLKLQIIT